MLIAGGRDKEVDHRGLAAGRRERAVAAVLIGEAARRLEADFRAAGLAADEHAPQRSKRPSSPPMPSPARRSSPAAIPAPRPCC